MLSLIKLALAPISFSWKKGLAIELMTSDADCQGVKTTTISKMKKGAKLRDGFLLPENIDVLSSSKDDSLVKIEIHEGRNHIVKNFFKFFKKRVIKLKRIAVGPIHLGELNPGQITKLDYNEVEALHKLMTL